MLTIITATKNSIKHISKLVYSLQNQTSNDFCWIIIDGNSQGGTVEYLKILQSIELTIISQNDFGIYDALNKGIKLCGTKYYLILGADDILKPDAIEYLNFTIDKKEFDILSCNLIINKKIVTISKKPIWFVCHKALVSEHSVATLFKTDLHKRYGLYTNKYPIAADMFFLLKVYLGGAKFIYSQHILGEFGIKGISSRQHLEVICQQACGMVELGYSKYLQLLLLTLCLIKLLIKKENFN